MSTCISFYIVPIPLFTPQYLKHGSSFTPWESIHVLNTCIDSCIDHLRRPLWLLLTSPSCLSPAHIPHTRLQPSNHAEPCHTAGSKAVHIHCPPSCSQRRPPRSVGLSIHNAVHRTHRRPWFHCTQSAARLGSHQPCSSSSNSRRDSSMQRTSRTGSYASAS